MTKPFVLLGVGVVLLAVGVVWVLQGLGTLTGSFMTGQKVWFAIGLLLGLAGLVALYSGARRLAASRR
ncbi:MAG TPA: hypothetical protein VHF06_13045 [Pseudonocardiaceae bacterium]|nr:hypothetical protein [Pseudonocardiaceae bacterium]